MGETKRRLIAHIGTAKTGTSAIQQGLGIVEQQLRGEGIIHVPTVSIPALVKLPRPQEPDELLIRQVRDGLDRVSAQHPGEATLLLSWEVLAGDFEFLHFSNSAACATSLRRATEAFDVTIVVYLRRQDTFAESTYAQTVHTGRSLTFSQYMDEVPPGSFDWHRMLGYFADEFGKENLVVRRYDRSVLPKGSSIIRDFAEIIGSKALAGVEMDNMRTNPSFSRDALEVARVCNEGMEDEQRQFMRMLLQQTNSKLPFEKSILMTPEQRAEMLDEYQESNAAVAADYFDLGGEPLFTAPTERELTDPPPEGLTLEALARVLMRTELESHRRIYELSNAVNQLAQAMGMQQRRPPGM